MASFLSLTITINTSYLFCRLRHYLTLSVNDTSISSAIDISNAPPKNILEFFHFQLMDSIIER